MTRAIDAGILQDNLTDIYGDSNRRWMRQTGRLLHVRRRMTG